MAIAQGTTFTDQNLYFDVGSAKIARRLVIEFEEVFAKWAMAMNKENMVVRYPVSNELPIPSAIAEDSMQLNPEPENLLWFANISVSPVLLQLANNLMENPRKDHVTRVSDELQVIMSDACKSLNPGHTMQEATTWTRSQFWHPQDLIDFRRECQQNLNPDGANFLEFTWRSFDPGLPEDLKYSNIPGNWLQFTTRYRLYNGNDGDFYQVCENLDMVEMMQVPTV